MKKNWFAGAVLIMICSLVPVATSLAEEAAFSITANATMKEVLGAQVGKRVAITLAAGEEIEGILTQVGDSLVHISRIAGKEFYDSVVIIDRISAVRMRVRER